jgi:hypothetical protein
MELAVADVVFPKGRKSQKAPRVQEDQLDQEDQEDQRSDPPHVILCTSSFFPIRAFSSFTWQVIRQPLRSVEQAPKSADLLR